MSRNFIDFDGTLRTLYREVNKKNSAVSSESSVDGEAIRSYSFDIRASSFRTAIEGVQKKIVRNA